MSTLRQTLLPMAAHWYPFQRRAWVAVSSRPSSRTGFRPARRHDSAGFGKAIRPFSNLVTPSASPTTQPFHVCIVAGEPSGDEIGAALMRSLRQMVPSSGSNETNLLFSGVGGPQMEKAGLDQQSLFPMSDLSVMGLTEVVPSLPRLFLRADTLAEHIAANRPNVVVTIDSKGFNFRMIRRAQRKLRSRSEDKDKDKGNVGATSKVKFVHYVAPSVWAYKDRSVDSLFNTDVVSQSGERSPLVDRLLVLLPFERAIFQSVGIPTTFVGYPSFEKLFDASMIAFETHGSMLASTIQKSFESQKIHNCLELPCSTPENNNQAMLELMRSTLSSAAAKLRADLGFSEDDHVMLLLPGSRLQEVKRHTPILHAAIAKYTQAAPTQDKLRYVFLESPDKSAAAWLNEYVKSYWNVGGNRTCNEAEGHPIMLPSSSQLWNRSESEFWKLAAMSMADSAVSSSGTAVVELALCGCPTLCIYKTSWATGAIARRIAAVDSVSLPNIMREMNSAKNNDGDALIPEVLFEECNSKRVSEGMSKLILVTDEKTVERRKVQESIDEILLSMVPVSSPKIDGCEAEMEKILRPSAVAAREVLLVGGYGKVDAASMRNTSSMSCQNIVAGHFTAHACAKNRQQMRAFSSLNRRPNHHGSHGNVLRNVLVGAAVITVAFLGGILLFYGAIIGGAVYLARRLMGSGGGLGKSSMFDRASGASPDEDTNDFSNSNVQELLTKLREVTRLSRSFQLQYPGAQVDSLIGTQVHRSPGTKDALTMSFSVVDESNNSIATLFAIGHGGKQKTGLSLQEGNLFEALTAMQGTMEVLSTVYVVDSRTSQRIDITVHDGFIRGSWKSNFDADHRQRYSREAGSSRRGSRDRDSGKGTTIDIDQFEEKSS